MINSSSSSSSSTGYKEPEWAVQPTASSASTCTCTSSPWTLTEIKCGVEIAKHALSTRATTILGRAVDMVHVPLHHESISRQHARISFDSQGNPWLRDLQSAHGTFVNKRRLPPAAIGKVESNSHQKGARGIMLSVGDILKFGASSRYFSLEGPPPQLELELDPEQDALQAKLKSVAVAQTHQSRSLSSQESSVSVSVSTTTNTSKEEGISWGISMNGDGDADIADDNAENGSTTSNRSIPMDPLKIPEKHRKELDKLNAMKYKLTNLETEDSRIRRKGELTEGQEKQLQRNAERETALRKSIQDKEESLYVKLNDNTKDKSRSSKGRNKASNNMYNNSYEEEEDDYFDRTKENNSRNNKHGNMDSTEEAETEETLTVKWMAAHEEQNHLNNVALLNANNRVDTLKDKLKKMQASGDEETFFVQNDLQLARESKKKIESSIAEGHTTIDEIEKLLKIVNPKIHTDRTTGYIGEGRQAPPPSSSLSSSSEKQNNNEGEIQENHDESRTTMQPPPMLPPPPKQNTNFAAEPCSIKKIDHDMAPPPSTQNKSVTTASANNNNNEIVEFTMPPPNKRKRILGPVTGPPITPPSPPSLTSSTVARKQSSTSKDKRIGTSSFLNNPTTSSSSKINYTPKNNESTVDRGKQKQTSKASQQLSMNSISDVWRALEGQDGSGKTKLNEKFAGRY